MAEERGTYAYMAEWLNKLGYSPDMRMVGKVAEYWGWYTASNGWYSYEEKRGLNTFKMTRETMNPAALVAEAWSDLLMNEKLAVASEDKGMAEVLNAHFSDFGVAHADFVARAFALGTGGLAISVKGVSGDGMVHPDALIEMVEYDATQVLPLTWSANTCTQCAFATRVEHNGKDYDQCQAHVLIGGTYHILTQLFEIKTHKEVYPEGICTDLDTLSPFQTFALARPAVPNPHFNYCAMGASVFDKGISSIKAVDEALTSMLTHLRVAKPRVFLSEELIEKRTTKNAAGEKTTQYYAFGEADDITFRVKPGGENSQPMHVVQPDMRIADTEAAMNAGLNMLSLTCGLGEQYWSWDKVGGLKTATEVVSDSSMLARTLKKHQNAMRVTLEVLVQGVAGVCKHLCNTAVDPTAELAIDFDDGIITDTQTDKQHALSEISILQVPSLKQKYLVKYCGFTAEEAAAAVPTAAIIDVGL